MARGRRGGKASAKRKATAKRVSNRRTTKKAKANQISSRNIDRARSGGNSNADIRTGGSSTGREKGIMASQKANKIKGLEQSVGSLDRRIQNALNKGDTDTAKDLRSRLNKFTTNLGYARAAKSDGVQRDSSGRIVYTGSGNPVMNSRGRTIFDETKDQDFSDPTRKLQNTNRGSYNEMYPISGGINKALKYLSKDFSNKDIPYNLQDMPGIRYPLEEDPFFGGRSRDPNYRQDFFSAPLEEVTISDLVDDKSQPFTNDVVPYIHPAIDINTRNEVFAPEVDNLPANNFAELDKEFQEESKKYFEKKANELTFADKYPYQVAGPDAFPSYLNLFGQNDTSLEEQALLDALAADTLPDGTSRDVQDQKTSTALQGAGYNLDSNLINQLFNQGLLESGTNYFGNNNTTNPLVDQALASYYNNN